MSDFSDSNWSDEEFAQEYLDHAETYVPFRREMLQIVRSFCVRFLKAGKEPSVLDLGCGDGIMTAVVLDACPGAAATLVDWSQEMLDKAARRFGDRPGLTYLRAGFQDLVDRDLLEGSYDLIISSLAIHHLKVGEKESLFRYLHGSLNPGAHFVNMDVILAPSVDLEEWYMDLWNDWIDRQRRSGKTDRDFSDITRRYKENPDNVPDTLDFQLNALKGAGFEEVDCYYKQGVFVIFGGKKPRN